MAVTVAALQASAQPAGPCPGMARNSWTDFSSEDRPPPCYGKPARSGKWLVCAAEGRNGAQGQGGILDLCANRWTKLSTDGAPPPIPTQAGGVIDFLLPTEPHAAGDKLIVFGAVPVGATEAPSRFQAAHVLDLAGNRWIPMKRENEPTARHHHAEAFDGRRLFLWGGVAWGGAETSPLGDGALYDLERNVWTAVSADGAPSPRTGRAIWTPHGVFVWSECVDDTERCLQNLAEARAESFLYEPKSRKWRRTNAKGHPGPLKQALIAWTGDRVLVFGTKGWENIEPTGGLYDRRRNRWTPIEAHDLSGVRHETGQLGSPHWVGGRMVILEPCPQDPRATRPTRMAVFDPNRNRWEDRRVPFSTCSSHMRQAAFVAGDALYWFMGRAESSPARVVRYQPATERWSHATLENDRNVVGSHFVEVSDGIITMAGGSDFVPTGTDCDGDRPSNMGCDPSRTTGKIVPRNDAALLIPEFVRVTPPPLPL